ncbi:MAG: hypothetical protein KDE27_03790 [Planctomycetes bacterium]|nr:hypothetical protein [Planctomycetota bacterium]
MKTTLHRFLRPILLLLAASFAAGCCFHGHHSWGGWHRCAPIRHCR